MSGSPCAGSSERARVVTRVVRRLMRRVSLPVAAGSLPRQAKRSHAPPHRHTGSSRRPKARAAATAAAGTACSCDTLVVGRRAHAQNCDGGVGTRPEMRARRKRRRTISTLLIQHAARACFGSSASARALPSTTVLVVAADTPPHQCRTPVAPAAPKAGASGATGVSLRPARRPGGRAAVVGALQLTVAGARHLCRAVRSSEQGARAASRSARPPREAPLPAATPHSRRTRTAATRFSHVAARHGTGGEASVAQERARDKRRRRRRGEPLDAAGGSHRRPVAPSAESAARHAARSGRCAGNCTGITSHARTQSCCAPKRVAAAALDARTGPRWLPSPRRRCRKNSRTTSSRHRATSPSARTCRTLPTASSARTMRALRS